MFRILRFDLVEPTKGERHRFDCGEPALNRWLATQARQSMSSRDAVTYVLLDEEGDRRDIAGYHALAAGSVERTQVPTSMHRHAPDPVPAIVLARFAIDRRHQGQGLGSELLVNVFEQSIVAGSNVGARVLVVHAMTDGARAFYLGHGFQASAHDTLTLMLDLRVVAASLDAAHQRNSD